MNTLPSKIGAALIWGGLCVCAAFGPLTFASMESKTLSADPVHDRIELLHEDSKDIWLMQQSHDGADLPLTKWD